jgi:hypothetical protein
LGLVEAIATTAVPITPELEKEILAKVATLTDKKVTLVNKVDPTIIGGFILRIDDVAQCECRTSTQLIKTNVTFKRNIMAEVKAAEVSAILKQQLTGFDSSVSLDEVGSVLQVGDGIARVYGLSNAQYGELVTFALDWKGSYLTLKKTT